MSWRQRLGVRPNRITRLAARHPVAYSVGTGLLGALLAVGKMSRSMSTTAVVVSALLAGIGLLVLNMVLWRRGGPGRRWYDRQRTP